MNHYYEIWFSNMGYASVCTWTNKEQAKEYAERKGFECLLLRTEDREYTCVAIEQWHPLNGWSTID
jgi:hypothetical protein